MSCLYASDYGPADPAFDPLADGGRLLQGFEGHTAELGNAQNLGQLQAMERQLHRGDSIAWCDQGYARVEAPAVHAFLAGFLAFVALPYAVRRLTPRLWHCLLHRAERAAGSRNTGALSGGL